MAISLEQLAQIVSHYFGAAHERTFVNSFANWLNSLCYALMAVIG